MRSKEEIGTVLNALHAYWKLKPELCFMQVLEAAITESGAGAEFNDLTDEKIVESLARLIKRIKNPDKFYAKI